MQCAVEMDLTRYQRGVDAEDAADEALEAQVWAERAHAEAAMAQAAQWGWDSARYLLHTTDGVPYYPAEVLQDALERRAPGVDEAYAALMASPEAKALREALVDHWLQKMWGG